MRTRQKRQSSPNDTNETEETPTPPSSSPTANTSTSNNDSSPEAVPSPKKRKTLDAPAVPLVQQKQLPELVNEEPIPMNVLMQNFAKVTENYNQLKKEMEQIQKHDPRNFVVTNEYSEQMKEFSEKAIALNASTPDGVHIQPIRQLIQLVIKNCRERFTKDDFQVVSTPKELFGFKWLLVATTKEKGYLTLFLVAQPPKDFTENYRIKVDYRFSVLNASTGKDLIEGENGQVYTKKKDHPSGYGLGFPKMAKLEDLLDKTQGFLKPEGDIHIRVDFTINASTLNHLGVLGGETHRELACLFGTQ